MSPSTPYAFIQCPCSDSTSIGRSGDVDSQTAADLDDDRTFDPSAPRSNYSLYPLEYLLYCEDCHQIRCPRCMIEEIVTYYCPNCLFEVPTSNIKSEGNRCTRSCFQCPICVGPLSVTNIEASPNPNLLAAENAAPPSGPYVLTCAYCQWSSTEIGIKFDKPNGIHAQMMKVRNGGATRLTPKERREKRKDAQSTTLGTVSESPVSEKDAPAAEELDMETQFGNLKQFYQQQISDTSGGAAGLSALGDLGFNSPGSLSRIMSLYTTGSYGDKSRVAKARVGTMREALTADEGLQPTQLHDGERATVARLQRAGWDGTASAAQRAAQPPPAVESAQLAAAGGRLLDALRPVPYLLRTKRSKRCSVCRHIMSKPEAKINLNRFRIRLVAGNYIPSIAIRPLAAPAPAPAPAPSRGASASATAPAAEEVLLTPLKPVQYLLTFKNPIFEPVKVTLATPATTPGRFASTVTVLCPQFDIDANTDVWDEALNKDGDKDRRRRKGEDAQRQDEAGKIWERGRNWVSIVVEVVPSSLRLDALALRKRDGQESADLGPLREDEDVLEIPMFVRVEWEADPANDDVGSAPGKDREAKEKRELAYWCVLGIGRISQD